MSVSATDPARLGHFSASKRTLGLAEVIKRLPVGTPAPTPEQWSSWRTHRACEPVDAWLLQQVALVEPSVLPRWHQDDRGRRDAHRGVHVLAPDGAYSGIPAWRNRAHWLSFTVSVSIGANRHVLRRHQVGASTFRRFLALKSTYGHSNGRQVIVRPDTLAGVLSIEPRQVERMNAAARELGLEAVVLRGRMLTLDESWNARRRGSRQRGLSTEVALTVPSPLRHVVDQDTPTRGRTSRNIHTLETGNHDAASGELKVGAPRRASKKATRKRSPGGSLAREVLACVPWLASEAAGRLAPALSRFATAPHPWTGRDVADGLRLRDERLGLPEPVAEAIRTRPVVLLAAMLRELDPYADHPRLMDLEAPCDRPDCDGHGWITTPAGVAKCPTCPEQLRRNPTITNSEF